MIDSRIVPVDLGHDRRGLLLDVSLTGASVQPYGILRKGESSSMKFELPESGARFEGTGVVAWTNASGRVGIEFVNVPAAVKSNLGAWIEEACSASGAKAKAGTQLAAAYLPPSYSPWVKVSETLKASVAAEFDYDTGSLDLVSALRLLLDRAKNLTSASGAAIALADGRDVVCRARTGLAPELGSRFSPDSGLSGEAVRAGKTVMCADTSTDSRVDSIACQNLKIRSVLIVPVKSGNAVIGVVEVFSQSANRFAAEDVSHLERIADLIEAMLDSTKPCSGNGKVQ